MIDSALDTAASVRPLSHPFELGGRWSTYSRIACARNSSANRATMSGGGLPADRNLSEDSTHSACSLAALSVSIGGSASIRGWFADSSAPRNPHQTNVLSPSVPSETRCTPSSVTQLIL